MAIYKRVLGSIGIAALAAMAAASFAWACTVQPYMSVRGPGTSAANPSVQSSQGTTMTTPGATVTVELANGNSAFSGAEAVEIRWNGATGPVLATVRTPSFSVPVQVPAEVAPGVYYIVAVGRGGSGAVFGKASTTLAVTAPVAGVGSSVASGDPWSGFNQGELRSPSLAQEPSASGTSPGMVGVGVLSGGVVALVATSGALVAKRRRALARASNQ